MGKLARDVGPAALEVTLGGLALALADVGSITIRRGRRSVDEQPTAATCTLAVYEAALVSGLPTVGEPLEISLGPDALTWLGITADDPAVPRFVGTVTDARIVPGRFVGLDRDVVQIVATSPLAKFGRVFVGDVPWPQELDGQRAWRIIRATGSQGSDFVTYVDPDLRGNPPPWLFTRTGSATLSGYDPGEWPTQPDVWSWALDTTGAAGPGVDLQDYFLGVTVSVTPGETIKIRWTGQMAPQVGTTPPAAFLVIGPQETPVNVRGNTSGGSLVDVHNVESDLYTVPAGVSELTIGVALRDADRYYTPGIKIDALTLVPFEPGAITEIDGGTVEVVPRDVDRQNALGLLTSLAFDARGLIIDRRGGQLEYADADDRRGAPVAVTLDDAEVIVGTEWATTLEGLVNDVTLSYGTAAAGSDPPSVRVIDQASVDAYGTAAISRQTPLALQADADRMARRIIGLLAQPAYRMTRLTVDALRTLTTTAKRAALLRCEQSALIEVTDFPTSGPLTTGRLWLEGWTEIITPRDWRFELDVSSYVAGGPGITYDDVPDTLTYDQVPDDIAHATAWGYDPTI